MVCHEGGYEEELDDYLGHPLNPLVSPSSALLKIWPPSNSGSALASFAAQQDPKNWKEAMESSECTGWEVAAEEEMDSLKEAGVYKVVPRSQANGRVVSSK